MVQQFGADDAMIRPLPDLYHGILAESRPLGRLPEGIDWVNVAWIGGLSVVMFVGSLFLVPWLIVRLPPDYFLAERRPSRGWMALHPGVRVLLRVGRNIAAIVLILAGLAMLVLPGQGMLTILVGFMVSDFPGKYRVERWIVSRPSVLRVLNWIRVRAGHPPLILERSPSSGWSRG